ncbi:hypothetical protein RRG08_028466 [Elysia crispata]|uniref:Uncharacterized protein n=1 Tax=Elysia crispata TaxID=231223 RepID=A0AAE1AU31_9GAST|nr:hypothetical protein RRG08_028466 [Elysia crispata]
MTICNRVQQADLRQSQDGGLQKSTVDLTEATLVPLAFLSQRMSRGSFYPRGILSKFSQEKELVTRKQLLLAH